MIHHHPPSHVHIQTHENIYIAWQFDMINMFKNFPEQFHMKKKRREERTNMQTHHPTKTLFMLIFQKILQIFLNPTHIHIHKYILF